MKHGSLFSGIGGFDLAAEWIGWENIFHCEINPFGQKILKYYWPEAELIEDITKFDFTKYAGSIDIISGGFPCQPFSLAGKRKGTEDDRHLWPEMLRVIREIRPSWVVGENVFGIINWDGGLVFDQVQSDLEAEGYEVQPYVLPAVSVNAPHRRDRVWFVAYRGNINSSISVQQRRQNKTENINLDRKNESGATSDPGHIRSEERQEYSMGIDELCKERTTPDPNINERPEGRMYRNGHETAKRHISAFGSRPDRRTWQNFPTQSPICSENDGFPGELDGITFPKWRNESIKAYGNAVVPVLVYQIFKAIQTYDNHL